MNEDIVDLKPFVLRTTNQFGQACVKCTEENCIGCEVPATNEPVESIIHHLYLCADWEVPIAELDFAKIENFKLKKH